MTGLPVCGDPRPAIRALVQLVADRETSDAQALDRLNDAGYNADPLLLDEAAWWADAITDLDHDHALVARYTDVGPGEYTLDAAVRFGDHAAAQLDQLVARLAAPAPVGAR